MTGPEPSLAILVQGPVVDAGPGRSTYSILEALDRSSARSSFTVVYSAWDDEGDDARSRVGDLVDRLVVSSRPDRRGSGNRRLQATAVAAGLDEVDRMGIGHVLKTRSDVCLSPRFLRTAEKHLRSGSEWLLVTNLFTRWESFHVSDMLVASTVASLRCMFEVRDTYYEDLYSP